MINSIFILNPNGEVIIEKHYVGLVGRSICDKFWDEVTNHVDPHDVPPIITTSKWYLLHIQHNKLFFLAITKQDTPPLIIFEFLERVVEVFGHYMSEITEENIRDKFVIVYQLLDEMMDGGFPFTTEPNILTSMISKNNILTDLIENIPIPGTMNIPLPMSLGGVSAQLPRGTSSISPWRAVGVRYTTNEIYFDIIEELDAIIDKNDRVLSCSVWGTVTVNCRLSGMPDLNLWFHNARVLEDVSFHPCVRYNRWDQNRVVSFVPPDGVFKLLNYRATSSIEIPLHVKPQISFVNTGGRVHITLSPKSTVKQVIGDVLLVIPFSSTIASTNLTATFGTVQYDEGSKVCVWRVGKMPKDRTPILSGNVSLPTGTPPPDSNPIIEVRFRVNQYSASGLKVESLNLHNENYKPYKGVKNVTQAGRFQVRT